MAVQLNIKISEGLLALIDEQAGPKPRNEWIAEFIANGFNRPELGIIPRLPMGRPRKAHRRTARR